MNFTKFLSLPIFREENRCKTGREKSSKSLDGRGFAHDRARNLDPLEEDGSAPLLTLNVMREFQATHKMMGAGDITKKLRAQKSVDTQPPLMPEKPKQVTVK